MMPCYSTQQNSWKSMVRMHPRVRFHTHQTPWCRKTHALITVTSTQPSRMCWTIRWKHRPNTAGSRCWMRKSIARRVSSFLMVFSHVAEAFARRAECDCRQTATALDRSSNFLIAMTWVSRLARVKVTASTMGAVLLEGWLLTGVCYMQAG